MQSMIDLSDKLGYFSECGITLDTVSQPMVNMLELLQIKMDAVLLLNYVLVLLFQSSELLFILTAKIINIFLHGLTDKFCVFFLPVQ